MHMEKIVLSSLLFSLFMPTYAAQVQPITINPTVKSFDSIPSVQTDLTFFVGTVQDTSLQRDTSGIVGSTRIRHRKMAPITCKPSPALVVKRSLEGLLEKKGLNAPSADSADFTIQILLYDFSLVETYKKLAQTMDANIAIEVTLIGRQDSSQKKQYIIRTQNSKSTIDTSKYAESILRGAIENAFKEILKNITR
jgi:hypothetical protein